MPAGRGAGCRVPSGTTAVAGTAGRELPRTSSVGPSGWPVAPSELVGAFPSPMARPRPWTGEFPLGKAEWGVIVRSWTAGATCGPDVGTGVGSCGSPAEPALSSPYGPWGGRLRNGTGGHAERQAGDVAPPGAASTGVAPGA